ncbi:MAG TPA: class B sortase [Clostridiales bacterium]|nr:class B sortase [Clostridiales bacterium]
MSANNEKKDLLNVRLTNLDGDTPETLRVVAQARAALGRYSHPEVSDEISVDSGKKSIENNTNTDDFDTKVLEIPVVLKQESPQVREQPQQDAAENPENSPRGFKKFLNRMAAVLGGVIPQKGDPPLEILRKCIFNIALITLIVSLAYIINDMIIIPFKNHQTYDSLASLYDPDNPADPPADFPEYKYPEGIMDSFKALYAMNDQIRGWLKYKDSNGKWLNINYPVMYSGDNEYYLTHDFQKARNKNGALFFDERNNLETPNDTNRVLIIYGHNMASGQMLSPLNKMLNNLNYVRSAPVINLDTLFDRREYKVFAVMLLSTRKEDGPYFNYLRTSFADDEDFMDFVANIRARSIYDFNSVDIRPDDQLLILSTCTTTSGAKFPEGRCVVVARKVRDGESVAIRPSDIVKNDDVIMPYAWYVNQKLEPHRYYTDSNYTIPGAVYSTTRTIYNPTTPTTYTGYPTSPVVTRPTGSTFTTPEGSSTLPTGSGTDTGTATGTGTGTGTGVPGTTTGEPDTSGTDSTETTTQNGTETTSPNQDDETTTPPTDDNTTAEQNETGQTEPESGGE